MLSGPELLVIFGLLNEALEFPLGPFPVEPWPQEPREVAPGHDQPLKTGDSHTGHSMYGRCSP